MTITMTPATNGGSNGGNGGNGDARLVTSHGRPILFTPERIDQIRNLVERGKKRDEIAEIIGCTAGSLAVTCSRLGISLRQPRPDRPTRQKAATPIPDTKLVLEIATADDSDNNNGEVRTIPFRISREELVDLALDAAVRGMTLAERLRQLLELGRQKEAENHKPEK